MDGQPPPPPPPHGEGRGKRGGLPDGNYDIFIIPPHMAGGGFLYLPSLRPNTNSFIAGFVSAFLLVFLYHITAPAFVAWWNSVKGSGGVMVLIMLAIGAGAWVLGRTSTDGVGGIPGAAPGAGPPPTGHGQSNGYAAGGGAGPMPGAGGYPGAGSMPRGGPGAAKPGPNNSWQRPPDPQPNTSWQRPPEPQPNTSWQRPPEPQPNTSWQRPPEPEMPPPPRPQPQAAPPPPKPQPQAAPPPPRPAPQPQAAPPPPKPAPPPPKPPSTAWERSKEETKRKEEERKAKEEERKAAEAAQKKKEEDDRRRKELVEKMRQAREKEKAEREAREAREAKEKKEKEEREAKEREAKEKKEKEAAEAKTRGSSYAYSTVGEKISLWPSGRPPAPAPTPQPTTPKTSPVKPTPSPSPSPTKPTFAARPTPAPPSPTKPSPPKRPPPPTAHTYHETEEDAYSYRPYDKPKRHPFRRPSQSSMFSESSYAASQSTARTTPPPSRRGKYTNKDPDKIILKAVYSFNNTFIKTPSSQLVSGVGSVTDGLILRITTEGLFIDDDVRGVAQREWDVKAWTLKLVEVWCPSFLTSSPSYPNPLERGRTPLHPTNKNPVRRLWDLEKDLSKDKVALNAQCEAFLRDLVVTCKEGNCSSETAFLNSQSQYSPPSVSRFPSSASSSVYSASTQSSQSTSATSSSYTSSYSSARSSSIGSSSPSDFTSSSASAKTRNPLSPSTASQPTAFGSRRYGRGTNIGGTCKQQGKWEAKGLHCLRASIRDAEGKRFLFVLGREEAWKVVEGLARLRRGTQVRALGLTGMSDGDAKGTLEGLGWG